MPASALYARAEAAHSAGRNDEAATLYDQVRRRYPNDGHAGLAAFEAGRLRLYSLSDPRGAVDSLGFAMRHMTGTYREDAEALRVEALARGGDVAACRSARDAFTKRYPSSPRAASIAAECP